MLNSLKFWLEFLFLLILPCGFLVGILRIVLHKHLSESNYCETIVNVLSIVAALVCMEGLLYIYQYFGI